MVLDNFPCPIFLMKDCGQAQRDFLTVWQSQRWAVRYPTHCALNKSIQFARLDLYLPAHLLQLCFEHSFNRVMTCPPFVRVSADEQNALLPREEALNGTHISR